MNQQLFNIAATLAMFSMAVALFSLKKEYEGFRRDVVKIVGGLGILVKNNSQGMTLKVKKRRSQVKDKKRRNKEEHQ